MVVLAAASLALGAVSASHAAPFASPFDSSYVVQLYETRDRFVPPPDSAPLQAQLMTTESGQTFECFLPSFAPVESETAAPLAVHDRKEPDQDTDAFLAFSRAAVREMASVCVEYKDTDSKWLYELCANFLVRRFRKPSAEVTVGAAGEVTTAKVHEGPRGQAVEEVGIWVADSSRDALKYDEFTDSATQKRVEKLDQPLFTQTFGKNGHEVQVQFTCSTSTARDDAAVAAVQWRESSATDSDGRDIAAFLVESRVFCNAQEADADSNEELASVQSLLQPLQDAYTCVTRNEGWWTYEYCFGRSLRQFHRDDDGQLTADYSLGVFDAEGNRELERLDSALVLEPIDEAQDMPRPAFVELYDFGTLCKTSQNQAPRKAKVFHYCSRDGSSQRLVMAKETQTCVYTVKVSSPVLCDHPHFLSDERESDETFEIVHCIPALEAVEVVEAAVVE